MIEINDLKIDESIEDIYGECNPNNQMTDLMTIKAETSEEIAMFEKAFIYTKEWAEAIEFSDRDTHAQRNQTNTDKRILDTAIGKLAEVYCYKYLAKIIPGLPVPGYHYFV